MTAISYDNKVRKILLIFISLWGFANAALLPIGSGPLSKIESFSSESKLFPRVNGTNLEGEQFIIPQDLEGQKKLLLIAYKRKQQEDINTWLTATVDLLKKYPDFSVYEVPTLKEFNFLMRFNINNGMRYGIDSKEQRERTITLYLDKETFNEALQIESEDTIYAFLLNQKNEIIWRTQGLADQSYINELEELLKND
jgi:hypothetical protein